MERRTILLTVTQIEDDAAEAALIITTLIEIMIYILNEDGN